MAEAGHKPKLDGTCSLLCTCDTPLTEKEIEILDDLGLF